VPQSEEEDVRGFEWRLLWKWCHNQRKPWGRHEGQVYFARSSPDGRTLASCGTDGIRIWALVPGRELMSVDPYFRDGHEVLFLPDGEHLACRGHGFTGNETLTVWRAPPVPAP
jgi:hypothetical protein